MSDTDAATSRKRRVLITGGAGRIGTSLAQSLKDHYDFRLIDRRAVDEHPSGLPVEVVDITDFAAVQKAMEGVEAVIHLAADPSPAAPWESVRDANIVGTYNVFEAARLAGARKIVFATTNHVMGMYDRDRAWPIYSDQPIRPDSLYGVSKAFGEALGRFYSDQYGMSIICMRIGWFLPKPHNHNALWSWLSPRDAAQFVWRALESPLQFGIFYAISNNAGRHWDITDTIERLGYRPEDNGEAFAGDVTE